MSRPISKDHGRFKSNVPEQTAIFPIMLRAPSEDVLGSFDFMGLGTGFFISKFGLFVTAKHVVEDHLEYQNGKGLEAWIIINKKTFTCPISHIHLHETADIALGFIVPPRREEKMVKEFAISLCKVSSSTIGVGESVYSYGYPRTKLKNDENEHDTVNIEMNPDYYTGKILEYHHNGISICKWPVYRHSVPIASGMSGSPLIRKRNNSVVGVSCTGYSSTEQDVAQGTSTDIKLCLAMRLEADIPGHKGKRVSELLEAENNLI